jgi:general secretion pathway protein M
LTGAPKTRPASGRRQALAVAVYVAVVIGLAGASVWLVSGLLAEADALADAQDRLARIEGREQPGRSAEIAGAPAPVGSPFLEGRTVTVSGATLQQRIGSAVAKAGGALLSSQIDLDGPQAKEGFVDLAADVQIAQPALQPLLYDIEAGMPYLTIDKLAILAPQAGDDGEQREARLRVSLSVSGQWGGVK